MSRSFFTFRISRRFILAVGLLAFLAAGFFMVRLVRQNTTVQQVLRARLARQIVSDCVDNHVLKILELLAADVKDLHNAALALWANPYDGSLDEVRAAFETAFGTWKRTAACQYGPATQYDYHKRLASWPCEKILVENALSRMERGTLIVDARYLREERVSSLRGFYTIQYLLFRNGKLRDASDFTATELRYLIAATQALLEDAVDFEASWCGTENLSSEKKTILQEAGIKKRPGYAKIFRNPGDSGSRYASLSDPLQEVLQDVGGVFEDMMPVLHELPDAMDSEKPAYWHSLNPCADLLNVLQSAEDAYLGGVEGFRGHAIADLVAAHDPELDRLIRISFAHTAYRLEVLRKAEGISPEEKDLAVRIAEDELEKLIARLGVAVPQVVLDPAVKPYAAYVTGP